jgi:adenine-specific DNA-methyltransferase
MSLPLFQTPKPIHSHFQSDADIVLFNGNIQDLLAEISDKTIQLVITSPPYNLGKDYEHKVDIEKYLEQQTAIIAELYRVLKVYTCFN